MTSVTFITFQLNRITKQIPEFGYKQHVRNDNKEE